jgi:hypothetical protein
MSTISRLITVGAASLCLVLFATPVAHAVSVPITLGYTGVFTVSQEDPSYCGAGEDLVTDTLTGTGSHLGRFTASYPHCVDFAANWFSGTATFIAPNGDVLEVELEGSAADPACLATGICDVGFTGIITGGTGRFQNAAGTLTGTGEVNLLESSVTAELHGSINKNPEPF